MDDHWLVLRQTYFWAQNLEYEVSVELNLQKCVESQLVLSN